MAIGTARLFGFDLKRNFAFPYFSRDMAEFWRRWHISLSSWFRDYLYIPLGGQSRQYLEKNQKCLTRVLCERIVAWCQLDLCGLGSPECVVFHTTVGDWQAQATPGHSS